ncbi:hypothetical protein C3L33_13061, partial [Rhododendron williamsianum]
MSPSPAWVLNDPGKLSNESRPILGHDGETISVTPRDRATGECVLFLACQADLEGQNIKFHCEEPFLLTLAQPGPVLLWAQRVKIAVGAAKGLEYLHEKAKPHIIHRDIKSSNVLLFDDDVAKVADFDLSNQAPDMAARLHSTRVLGTFGYHAPEYAMTGQLSSKSDVYSFGVVLLELLTGRKPVDHTLPRGQQSLVTWATPKLSEDKVKQCVDARLGGDYPPKAVAKMAAVAALCVQYEADFRPNMSIVVKALQPLLNTRSGPHGETPVV